MEIHSFYPLYLCSSVQSVAKTAVPKQKPRAVADPAKNHPGGRDGVGSRVRPLRYNQRDALLNGDFIALGDPALPWRQWV